MCRACKQEHRGVDLQEGELQICTRDCWQDCVVVQCCRDSLEQCLLFISVRGLQMVKSYLRSYPDLSPDGLGGLSRRQLDFVT